MLVASGERKVVRRPRPHPIYDDFNPPDEWVEEPSYYILRLYLPQVFRKEDLNIVHDQSGKLTVRGKRLVGENRFARFESSYNVPKDSNLDNISGKIESNILSLTIPKIAISKPSEEKKEEPVMEEKPKIVAEEKKEEPVQNKPTTMEEKSKIVTEEKKEEEALKDINEEAKKKIKETAAMKEFHEKLPSIKEPKLEERKDEAVQKEMKEEQRLKEKQENLEEKKESIQKDNLEGFDTEKKEDSARKEETWEDAVGRKGRDVQKKQPKKKESKKRRWLWDEEDKGKWLDWMDSSLIDDVLKKIYRNKKCITVVMVAFTAGYYVSRKLRTRG